MGVSCANKVIYYLYMNADILIMENPFHTPSLTCPP
jgi:hypothetical protein